MNFADFFILLEFMAGSSDQEYYQNQHFSDFDSFEKMPSNEAFGCKLCSNSKKFVLKVDKISLKIVRWYFNLTS